MVRLLLLMELMRKGMRMRVLLLLLLGGVRVRLVKPAGRRHHRRAGDERRRASALSTIVEKGRRERWVDPGPGCCETWVLRWPGNGG